MNHSGLGSRIICAASTTSVAGSTIRSGTILCSRSTAEIATSTQQKNAAIAASRVRPKSRTHAATSSAETISTAG